MSMQRKDPTEALAALRADAITITTEQCIPNEVVCSCTRSAAGKGDYREGGLAG